MDDIKEETKDFNLDDMKLTNKLSSLHQEGNFLVGVTEYGIRFRQRIPTNKMLHKNENGDWILIDMRVNTAN